MNCAGGDANCVRGDMNCAEVTRIVREPLKAALHLRLGRIMKFAGDINCAVVTKFVRLSTSCPQFSKIVIIKAI